MFEQLGGAEERYQAINDQLMDPNVVSDPKQYAQLMKEYKNLTPIVEKYREYKKAQEDMLPAKHRGCIQQGINFFRLKVCIGLTLVHIHYDGRIIAFLAEMNDYPATGNNGCFQIGRNAISIAIFQRQG